MAQRKHPEALNAKFLTRKGRGSKCEIAISAVTIITQIWWPQKAKANS